MIERIRKYLEGRGIKPEILSSSFVRWDGDKIVIPIKRPDGTWFNKYRRDPVKSVGQKYWADQGGSRTLYLRDDLEKAKTVYVTEGELDALRLKSAGLTAVTSTTGASNWDESWSPLFKNKIVYVWYDADESGEKGSLAAARAIAREAAIVYRVRHDPVLGKDVTDVLLKLGDGILADERIRKGLIGGIRAEIVEAPALEKPRSVFRSAPAGPKPSLTAAMERYGVKFRRAGRELTALCLFHDDKHPSMSVSVDKGLYFCHSCGAAGDVYTLIMEKEKVDFKEARKILNA